MTRGDAATTGITVNYAILAIIISTDIKTMSAVDESMGHMYGTSTPRDVPAIEVLLPFSTRVEDH